MTNPEQLREMEKSAERQCVEWLHTQLEELAGFDFTDEELEAGLQAYLKEKEKNVLELKEEDRQLIFGDILQKFLDSGEEAE